MLCRQYVEALLVDAVLADCIWELWNAGVITDLDAAWAWCRVAEKSPLLAKRDRNVSN